ncbi:DUF4301 family protein [Pararhodonellum marinum]|uniref:DUF4301 family protein n=1 Tax=Pararhodonellum marinum TaxID=2755358 RepID=UPI00188E43CE|nr:DUF4301 family protein [Pararhodonellum marinum]
MITATIKEKIARQGMSETQVAEQIKNFQEGFPFLKIEAAATIGNGVKSLSEEEVQKMVTDYPLQSKTRKIVKFVPASGAASRMFKDLFGFLEGDHEDLGKNAFVKKFMDNIKSFAFYQDLDNNMKASGSSIEKALADKQYKLILTHLLDDSGLGYGNLPKGLLRFHRYPNENRTPAHEHFVEGLQYGVGEGNVVRLHFTVSPEHLDRFKLEVAAIQPSLETKYGVKFDVSYSQQKASTNTIAVNMDNTPFEEEDGELLFRPAGHGALLENLNDIDADLIFIKNIDNVVPDRLKEPTKNYKMVLGGLLIDIQEKIFAALKKLENVNTDADLALAKFVFTKELGLPLPEGFEQKTEKDQAEYLLNKLDRPLRVCGMVKNTGEPGGGPFWVKESDGTSSLQIAETAQINLEDKRQKEIFQGATHFNPVDLACGTKDHKGNKFDLLKFRDPKTGFITEKSKSGRELKALELPGLWNGAMAGWNTVFVEVPLITFNPVKTVNDLLRDEHQ